MQNSRTVNERGVWDVRRRIAIPSLGATSDVAGIVAALEELEGVKSVDVELEKKRIHVAYDASRIDYHSITSLLSESGFPPLNSWWANMRAKMYQFTDSNARENANAPAPPCCNKPPK
jgi:copper chaperone CopZ